MKTCTRCGAEKALAEFVVHRQSSDGRGSWCKACQRIVAREWVRDHNAKRDAYQAAYRQRHSERLRAYQAAYRARRRAARQEGGREV